MGKLNKIKKMTTETYNAVEVIQPTMDFAVAFYNTIGIAGAMWALHYSPEYVKPDRLTAVYYAYAGVIITTLFSNLAAIYVSTKTVAVGMDFTAGLFKDYHTANALSCFLGIYEMGYIILHLVWSQSISFIGYYMAYAMWN